MTLIKYDLKAFRINNGLSQADAAKEFDIGQTTWSRRERMGKVPKLWTLAIDGWLENQRRGTAEGARMWRRVTAGEV